MRNDVPLEIHKVLDYGGNFIAPDAESHGKSVTIVSLYGPNEDRPKFYESIEAIEAIEAIEDVGNLTVLACGDWNFAHDLQKRHS